MYIAETMNRHEYVPKMPDQSDLDLIFDTGQADVQPYLYRVSNPLYILYYITALLTYISILLCIVVQPCLFLVSIPLCSVV